MSENVAEDIGLAKVARAVSRAGDSVMVVNCQGAVDYVSKFARQSIADGVWPLQTDGNKLVLSNAAQHDVLLQQVTDVLDGRIEIARLKLSRHDSLPPIFLVSTKPAIEERVMTTVRDPIWVGDHYLPVLRQIFGFTRREGQLASHLAGGQSLKEFARRMHLTRNTVKSHLKQVFKKAEVQSQMQLVAVVLAALR